MAARKISLVPEMAESVPSEGITANEAPMKATRGKAKCPYCGKDYTSGQKKKHDRSCKIYNKLSGAEKDVIDKKGADEEHAKHEAARERRNEKAKRHMQKKRAQMCSEAPMGATVHDADEPTQMVEIAHEEIKTALGEGNDAQMETVPAIAAPMAIPAPQDTVATETKAEKNKQYCKAYREANPMNEETKQANRERVRAFRRAHPMNEADKENEIKRYNAWMKKKYVAKCIQKAKTAIQKEKAKTDGTQECLYINMVKEAEKQRDEIAKKIDREEIKEAAMKAKKANEERKRKQEWKAVKAMMLQEKHNAKRIKNLKATGEMPKPMSKANRSFLMDKRVMEEDCPFRRYDLRKAIKALYRLTSSIPEIPQRRPSPREPEVLEEFAGPAPLLRRYYIKDAFHERVTLRNRGLSIIFSMSNSWLQTLVAMIDQESNNSIPLLWVENFINTEVFKVVRKQQAQNEREVYLMEKAETEACRILETGIFPEEY